QLHFHVGLGGGGFVGLCRQGLRFLRLRSHRGGGERLRGELGDFVTGGGLLGYRRHFLGRPRRGLVAVFLRRLLSLLSRALQNVVIGRRGRGGRGALLFLGRAGNGRRIARRRPALDELGVRFRQLGGGRLRLRALGRRFAFFLCF